MGSWRSSPANRSSPSTPRRPGSTPVWVDLVGLSFCWKSGEAYYLPLRAAVGSVLPVDLLVEKLRPVFEDIAIGKVGHHIKYDMLVTAAGRHRCQGLGIRYDAGELPARSDARVALARQRRDSTELGHRMIPISELIGKGKKQITIDQLDTQRVGEYAAEDADFTWRLYEQFHPRLTGSHVETLFHDTEMPLVEVLAENGAERDHAGL